MVIDEDRLRLCEAQMNQIKRLNGQRARIKIEDYEMLVEATRILKDMIDNKPKPYKPPLLPGATDVIW